MKKYVCTVCGFIYDEAGGIPSSGIAPGTRWEALPPDWVCPFCGAAKADFKEQQAAPADVPSPVPLAEEDELRALSVGELSALCSNLARGCEKQYLAEESALFLQLAAYFRSKTPDEAQCGPQELLARVQKDLDEGYVRANAAATAKADRGALRALVWSEKVTRILNSLLNRLEREGEAFLEKADVFVCSVCGFVFVGERAPELCPVCKVPSWKFGKVERREAL